MTRPHLVFHRELQTAIGYPMRLMPDGRPAAVLAGSIPVRNKKDASNLLGIYAETGAPILHITLSMPPGLTLDHLGWNAVWKIALDCLEPTFPK